MNSLTSSRVLHYYGVDNKFFLANLILGFVFLFALYFGVKTLRGLWLERKSKESTDITVHPQ